MTIPSVPLPRGYTAPDNTPWLERDDTHLRLDLHPDGSVRWRLVDSATGHDHPGFDDPADEDAALALGPMMGLATTDQLFEELIARLGREFDHELGAQPAVQRVMQLASVWFALPRAEREYRTVNR